MLTLHDNLSNKNLELFKKSYDNDVPDQHTPIHSHIQQSVHRSLEQIKNGEVMGVEEAFKLTMESYRP